MKGVDREDIRHMQSRVTMFTATKQLQFKEFLEVTSCKETFCRWLVQDATAYAYRMPISVPLPACRSVEPLARPVVTVVDPSAYRPVLVQMWFAQALHHQTMVSSGYAYVTVANTPRRRWGKI